jgi:hypothetical protein
MVDNLSHQGKIKKEEWKEGRKERRGRKDIIEKGRIDDVKNSKDVECIEIEDNNIGTLENSWAISHEVKYTLSLTPTISHLDIYPIQLKS